MTSFSEWRDLLAAYDHYLVALVVLVGGWLAARWLSRLFHSVLLRHLSPQHAMLSRRGFFYLLLVISFSLALDIAGVNVSVFLGAAGVLTIALGFAAQTSTSNLISGLFLMAERPFVLGDTIQTGTAFGEVISIDLLSVKIRTFDNVLLRLPNEALLKAEIANWTRLPIRRIDYDLVFPMSQSPEQLKAILVRTAENDNGCLDEPTPVFLFRGFDQAGYQVRFGVWTSTPLFIETRNRFFMKMHAALSEAGIDLAYPRRELLAPEALRLELDGSTPGSGESSAPS